MEQTQGRLSAEFPDIRFRAGGYWISLNSCSYEPPRRPWAIPLHSHNSYEIHFIHSGRGAFRTPDGDFPVHGGCVVVTGPGALHAQISGEADAMDEYCMNVSLQPARTHADSDDDAALRQLFDTWTQHPFFIGGPMDAAAESRALLWEAQHRAPGRTARLCALTLSLLILAARLVEKEPNNNAAAPDLGAHAGMNRKRVMDQYFRQYRGCIDANHLAELLFISRRQLNRVVQACYGMTFTEKLNQLRCEYARQLLRTTNRSVADIAAECGFSSTQYFYRVFAQAYGTTPAALRRAAANEPR